MTHLSRDVSTFVSMLYDIQREGAATTNLKGAAEDAHFDDIANREDAAYAAVAKCKASSVADFYQKLKVTLEACDLIPCESTGNHGGAGPREAALLVKSLMRDAERMFTTKGDERLIALCDEHDAARVQIERLNRECRADELPDEHEARLEALIDREFKALYSIIKIRPKTLMGAARMASVLPTHVRPEVGYPSDDRIERFVGKLSTSLNALAAIPQHGATESVSRQAA